MTTPIVPSITDDQLAGLEMHAALSFTDEVKCVATFGELRGLIARLRAAEKDAARYRWLRDRHNTVGDYLSVSDGPEDLILEEVVGIEGLDLDTAIDTAMEQQP